MKRFVAAALAVTILTAPALAMAGISQARPLNVLLCRIHAYSAPTVPGRTMMR